MQGNAAEVELPRKKKRNGKLTGLLIELVSDEDEVDLDDSDGLHSPSQAMHDAAKPWRKEFQRWLHTEEIIPGTIDMVTWWGVSSLHLPVVTALTLIR